jgi:hypothetical protein
MRYILYVPIKPRTHLMIIGDSNFRGLIILYSPNICFIYTSGMKLELLSLCCNDLYSIRHELRHDFNSLLVITNLGVNYHFEINIWTQFKNKIHTIINKLSIILGPSATHIVHLVVPLANLTLAQTDNVIIANNEPFHFSN